MKPDAETIQFRKQLGKRLRTIRLENELNQGEISKLFGISKGSVSEYENGKNEPSPSFLVKFAKKFNVDIRWLLQFSAQPAYRQAHPDTLRVGEEKAPRYSKKSEELLEEVVAYLKHDRELLETVWHLVRAREGLRRVTEGEPPAQE